MRFSVKRSEDHTSEIEQTFVSTKDCAKPISCTTSKFRSVTIREVFFGQAIHKAPLGLSDLVSMVILFSSSKLRVAKKNYYIKTTA